MNPKLWGCALLVTLGAFGVRPASPQARQAADPFQTSIKPFLRTYCYGCHSGNQPAASFDLTSYATRDSVVGDQRHWNLVLTRLKAGEMPPTQARQQPTPAERQSVIDWIDAVGAEDARRHPNDPGIVLARRLSNAEYDYTIHDLTGVDIRPTKEFPVDPANQAGFDNSGESLAMSPALVQKYLDAARHVADHVLFLPSGFTFAPYPVVTDEDRDKYAVNRIVDFYTHQPLDYADYFLAAWRFQHRSALRQPRMTLADAAASAKLSATYLNRVSTMLNATAGDIGDVGPLAALQARWKALPVPADHQEPKELRPAVEWMRDFIAGLRPRVAMTFDNLPARGIAAGSQSLVLWKDRQYAEHRTSCADSALQLDLSAYAATDPLLPMPAVPGTDPLARARYTDAFARFCAMFPDKFYVSERGRMFLTNAREIASDAQGHRLLSAGFHSQMGYFRDDRPLYDLVLDAAQQRQLDGLWKELDFITLAPVRQFKQFIWFERAEPPSFMATAQFNTFRSEDDDITTERKMTLMADAYLAKARTVTNDVALEVVRDYFERMNGNVRALEAAKTAAEPSHLDALLTLAGRAYRRPLTKAESDDLLAFYRSLRDQRLSHEDAIRDVVASVLMSPYFSYRADPIPSGTSSTGDVRPLSDDELANRLSYFLWSSMPDEELLKHAAAGDLHKPDVIAAQARRMNQDGRARRLATEFAGNWLDIRRFEEHNAVDRERFPGFTNELRQAMFEEPIRFVQDVIQRNGSVLDFLYGNYTFVNTALARHYGMPEPPVGTWIRINDAQKYERGGLMAMSAFLTKNAPGLRTSPVKRGYWIVHRLLGEYIPAPPPNVPVLPTDETKLGDLTLRETLAQHRANPACASCHAKFDSFGLAFEGYGPVGETRSRDLAGRPVETTAAFPNGTSGSGLAGLRAFMRARGQAEFVDTLSRELLVYALGRSPLRSDEPLLADMRKNLTAGDFKFGSLVRDIVTSRQFLTTRATSSSVKETAQ